MVSVRTKIGRPLPFVCVVASLALLISVQAIAQKLYQVAQAPVPDDAATSESPPAPKDTSAPVFIARETWPEGREVGELSFADERVFAIQSSLGGLSPYERAMIAAKRLNDFLEDYGAAGVLRIATVDGQQVIQGGVINIVTADEEGARRAGCTSEELAGRWIQSIKDAVARSNAGPPPGSAQQQRPQTPPVSEATTPTGPMGATVVGETTGAIAPAPEGNVSVPVPSEYAIPHAPGISDVRIPVDEVAKPPQATNTAHVLKAPPTEPAHVTAIEPAGQPMLASAVVPLLDGTTGRPLGRAEVSGSGDAVAQVKAVVELSEAFHKAARLRALVPSSGDPAIAPLARVPGVHVTGMEIVSGREAAE